MPEITLEQIAAAVAELRAANKYAVKTLKLPDPDDASQPYTIPPPASPADPADIAEAERALSRRFPPSYRHFLSLHDGWKEVDLGSDLLTVKAMVDFKMNYAERVLGPILGEIERDSSNTLIVFGKFPSDNSMFIFDAAKVNEFGEWSVIEYDSKDGMLDEYENFLDFLIDTADTMRLTAG